ncbi:MULTISPECIES: FtsK/SpoIIIE domain-containing protein [unclassified Adlercreutzia]|uniref:FtsK/SpoIIIE domain-containing protein n=1 Tax=unclassified Adlercreutzia TaxID=2636013 RepID=UPI0013EABF72|nr:MULTISPECIES: FtsK/SpoIIIE domain-containing protein [unclassified Adlercreutzia]
MEWVEDHLRLSVLLLFSIVGGVSLLFGLYAVAIAPLWLSLGIIYYSVRHPESEVSIQQDERDRHRKRLKEQFSECLREGGIEPQDEEQFDCLNDNPIRFVYHPMRYGSTKERLERIVEASLPAFKAVRADVERLPPNEEGFFGYEVVFYTETEIATLTAMSVLFDDLREEPTRERIPIGLYATGETAYMTLDGVVGGMIAGQSRSGKSAATSSFIAMLSRLENERLIVCSNKIMDFRAYEDRAELHDDPVDVLNVVNSLNDEAERRKAYCLEHGLKKIEQFSDDLPHITLIIDEYAILRTSVVEDPDGKKPRKVGDEVDRAVFRAASRNAAYGMSIFLITQRFMSGLVDTTTRSLLTSNLLGFSSGDARSDEMLFDTRADEAPSCEIPISSKGVGYIFCEGHMEKPRLFKAAYIDERTEKRIAEETRHLRPKDTDYGKEERLPIQTRGG